MVSQTSGTRLAGRTPIIPVVVDAGYGRESRQRLDTAGPGPFAVGPDVPGRAEELDRKLSQGGQNAALEADGWGLGPSSPAHDNIGEIR
jgi:hypothetical protein